MRVGPQGDHCRGVPQDRLHLLDRRSPSDRRAGVEVPQRVSCRLDLGRLAPNVSASLGRKRILY